MSPESLFLSTLLYACSSNSVSASKCCLHTQAEGEAALVFPSFIPVDQKVFHFKIAN